MSPFRSDYCFGADAGAGRLAINQAFRARLTCVLNVDWSPSRGPSTHVEFKNTGGRDHCLE
jgi:hypothetical protein